MQTYILIIQFQLCFSQFREKKQILTFFSSHLAILSLYLTIQFFLPQNSDFASHNSDFISRNSTVICQNYFLFTIARKSLNCERKVAINLFLFLFLFHGKNKQKKTGGNQLP